MPAKKTREEPKDKATEDSSAKTAPASEGTKGGTPPAPIKKPLGAKEVIPFQWKVVGVSANLMVTLFKATERTEVDAQYERLRKDGYYTELEVLPVDQEVVQPKAAKNVEITPKSPKPSEKVTPPPAKKSKKHMPVTATLKKAAPKKSTKKAAAKTATSSKTATDAKKKGTSSAKKTTTRKAPKKTAKKAAKKSAKKAPAKKTRKATKRK